MAKGKRIQELYYIRAIAAIGILIIHATGSFAVRSDFGTRAMYLGIFLNQFFRFGSPVFMMISGLVIFYNYRSMDEFDTGRFLKKKIKFILVPYSIWSALYFLYTSYIYKIAINSQSLLSFIRGLLLGENFSHLYFIFLIFQFYIVVPFLIKYLANAMKEKPLKVFSFFFIFQGIVLVYGYYFKDSAATGILSLFNRYYWKTLFSWCFYFIAGGIIGIHYDSFVKFVEKNIAYIAMGYIITTCFYIGQVYHNIWLHGGRDYYEKFGSIRPHTMIYALFTMLILVWLTRRMTGSFNYLKDFGTYSFGIYFSHPLILEELKRLLIGYFPSHIGYSRLSSLVLISLLGLGITFLLVLLIGTLEGRWLLLGMVSKYTLRKGKKDRGFITVDN